MIRKKKSPKKKALKKKRAFTLIELLVVLAIIAILAAILFPVFAAAKNSAKKAVCLSNMNQMGLAEIMYASDNDDTLGGNIYGGRGDYAFWSYFYVNGFENPAPAALYGKTNWQWQLIPYMKNDGVGSARVCPMAVEDTNADRGCIVQADQYMNPTLTKGAWVDNTPLTGHNSTGCSSYIFNGVDTERSTTAMPDPAGTIVMRESAYMYATPYSFPWNYIGMWGGPGWAGTDQVAFDANHNNGGNFNYADGHAKFRMKVSVHFSEFGFTGVCAGSDTSGQPLIAEQLTLTLNGSNSNAMCPTTTF